MDMLFPMVPQDDNERPAHGYEVRNVKNFVKWNGDGFACELFLDGEKVADVWDQGFGDSLVYVSNTPTWSLYEANKDVYDFDEVVFDLVKKATP